MRPAPLPADTLLFGRYRIQEVLGRGGFGITYLAKDGGTSIVLKELAPSGCERQPDGSLVMGGDQRNLVRAFVEEARLLRNFRHPRVLRVREAFTANDTAYCVTEFRAGVHSLEDRLRTNGPLPSDEVEAILRQLAEPLAALHEAGYLHRDLKPSNVLIDEHGETTLIDFGSARSFQADVTGGHTVVFTPGYAPLEQLTENARRGPGTDLYGLCALGYALLTGNDLPTPIDRLANDTPLMLPNTDLGDALAAGLEIQLAARPATVGQWLAILDGRADPQSAWARLEQMDAACLAARHIRPSRRECPQCHAPLSEPKPIAAGVCPVCHSGRLRKLDFDESRCPLCPTGRLRDVANRGPLVRCPACTTGHLAAPRGLPWRAKTYHCGACEAEFVDERGQVRRADGEEAKSWDEWLAESGRSDHIRMCDHCSAEFDRDHLDRWAQMVPPPNVGAFSLLRADEWARVAAGAAPDSGSHRCDACESEYWINDNMVTLLQAGRDPYGFATEYRGQALGIEAVRYRAVGKTSGQRGLVCPSCHLELDGDEPAFTVVRATEPGLQAAAQTPFAMLDLHRLAQGLPSQAEEQEFLAESSELLAEAIRSGDAPLIPRHPEILWRGPATWQNFSGTLTITAEEITLNRGLKKHRWNLDRFAQWSASEDTLRLTNDDEELALEIEPLDVQYALPGGTYGCELTALDLVEILGSFVEQDSKQSV
ncbi:MAG: protein kinase [Chthonomonas sp.]|nr:protein kinase [Chthonomonas sp.]